MKRFPFLSNADRRALLVLEWVLMLVVLGCFVYTWTKPENVATDPKHEKGAPATRRHAKSHADKTYTYAVEEEPVETFPFDPNTADSTQLLRLGLAPWQVRAIYRYRAKHGRYHTPDDFARLPGMTNEMWQRLRPQIRIAEQYRYVDAKAIGTRTSTTFPSTETNTRQGHADTLVQTSTGTGYGKAAIRDTIRFPEKYHEMVQIDINEADTNQLKKIPGIASYRASQIVKYRENLGGYVNTEQVMEACTLPDEVLDWFCLCNTQTRKVNINKASVQAMRKHPYISFYQARAISERRHDKGNFTSAEQLLQLKEFTEKDLQRLLPYITF